ncbi:MAG: metallophosphoesterase family protein [Pseudomonadota bacterium]
MKILAFSDLHLARNKAAALVDASKDADLVIAAGDFCNQRQGLDLAMAMLNGIAAPIVAVPGNAESIEELRLAAPSNMHTLHGSGIEIDGLQVFGLGYGIPPTPFGDWSCDLSESDADMLLAPCQAADILIFHSPPKGVADRTSTGASVGSEALREAVARLQPRLVVCGHIHDSWGEEGTIGRSQVVNLGPRSNWFDLSTE